MEILSFSLFFFFVFLFFLFVILFFCHFVFLSCCLFCHIFFLSCCPFVFCLFGVLSFCLDSCWSNVWKVSSLKSHNLCQNSKVAVTDSLTGWPRSGIELHARAGKQQRSRLSCGEALNGGALVSLVKCLSIKCDDYEELSIRVARSHCCRQMVLYSPNADKACKCFRVQWPKISQTFLDCTSRELS